MKKEKKTIEIPESWIKRLQDYIDIVRKNSNDDLGLKIAISSLLGYLESLTDIYNQPKENLNKMVKETNKEIWEWEKRKEKSLQKLIDGAVKKFEVIFPENLGEYYGGETKGKN